ncbi:hypothetical protein VTO73DRAFT_10426 [Trametes versicolor]
MLEAEKAVVVPRKAVAAIASCPSGNPEREVAMVQPPIRADMGHGMRLCQRESFEPGQGTKPEAGSAMVAAMDGLVVLFAVKFQYSRRLHPEPESGCTPPKPAPEEAAQSGACVAREKRGHVTVRPRLTGPAPLRPTRAPTRSTLAPTTTSIRLPRQSAKYHRTLIDGLRTALTKHRETRVFRQAAALDGGRVRFKADRHRLLNKKVLEQAKHGRYIPKANIEYAMHVALRKPGIAGTQKLHRDKKPNELKDERISNRTDDPSEGITNVLKVWGARCH